MKRSRSTEEQTVETLREQESEVNALFIEPDLPWKDEYNESFSTNLRGGRMNGDPFNDLWDAASSSRGRCHYNPMRPHRYPGGKPPAPAAISLANLAPF
ncbi:integrase core domain-containing protein [Pyruvatibacter sp. HU-CL02332]|uniref:integrase core domain-containing protein n=1 Tax=Pyruvatibacter sp. HU-CL02332 TaxID=3127650 RepID=UPI003107EEF3